MAKVVSSNRILQKLLFLQLILIFFHIGIRYFIDNTLVRDVALLLSIIVFVLTSRRQVAQDRVSGISLWMLGYGVVVMIVHSFTGASVINAVTQFRDFFLPLAIVPIYRHIFLDQQFRLKIVSLLFILFSILLLDVYIEFFMRLAGMSRDILPWYPYQYTHLYRFSTSPDAMPNAISPDQAPILGLIGWPLNTSAVLMGLFAFLLPWIMADRQGLKLLKFQQRLSRIKIIYIILTAGAFLILEVKTSILAFVVILFIYFFSNKGKIIKNLLVIVSLFAIVAILTKDFWFGLFETFAEEFADGELEYILSSQTMSSLLGAFLTGSPLGFLFGADYSHLPYFENLEIRLLVFTLELGIIWLILYCIMMGRVLITNRKFLRSRKLGPADSLLAKGVQLSLIAYLIDMLHYANQMYLFNIYFFGVMLALISSLIIQQRNAKSISNNPCI